MSDLPVLYSFRRCPFAMRARWALWVAGVAVAHREIVLRDKPAAMLAASPKGTVPVLVVPAGVKPAGNDEGDAHSAPQVIDESLDVMRWALARHDPERWLQPERGSLDEMLALIDACQAQFKPHLDRSKYPQRYGDEVRAWTLALVAQASDAPGGASAPVAGEGADERIERMQAEARAACGPATPPPTEAELASFVVAHRQHARVFLLALEARLLQAAADGPSGARAEAAGESGEPAEPGQSSVCPALFGTRPALADFAIAPFVRQFAQADAHWQSGDWPAVRAWLAAMLARPEFEAQVMRKHPLWAAPLA